MADERTFTLHQVDQNPTDFAIIEDQLEAIYARLQRTPTRVEMARTVLGTIVGAGGGVILWFELVSRSLQ